MRVQYIFLQASYSVIATHKHKPYTPEEPYDYSWLHTYVHIMPST